MHKLIFLLFLAYSVQLYSQTKSDVSVFISAEESLLNNWSDKGRIVVFFTRSAEREPVFQGTFSAGRNGFAYNITNWNGKNQLKLTNTNTFSSDFGLNEIPNGKWYVQAVYNISGKPQLRTKGNFYSNVKEIDLNQDSNIQLSLSKVIKSRYSSIPNNSEFVKYIELESKLLTAFWGKTKNIKASVLLPKNFKLESSKKYPVRLNIGGYGSSWTRASRLERDSIFMAWWQSDDAPEIINIFTDGDGPFGDPHYLDSKNSGPYGGALTQELIPHIEKEFNAIGSPEYRFIDGCSTGGWVSFALQVFYPDFFNGAWSFSADPVDFHHMQLINMYDGENAFYNEHGYLTPSIRSKTGQPRLSIKAEVAGENINSFDNTFTTSGGQWGGWNALFSPKGEDGLPIAGFHPVTGKINKEAAEHWKNYDLLHILKENWPELGPKLQGKLWVWMGDMDQFYLNNAMREMDKFLISTSKPKSDAIINFEATKGHCEEFDHRWVLEMMQEKIQRINSK